MNCAEQSRSQPPSGKSLACDLVLGPERGLEALAASRVMLASFSKVRLKIRPMTHAETFCKCSAAGQAIELSFEAIAP